MSRKVDKPYAGGQWSKAAYFAKIRGGLRTIRWPPRNEIMKKSCVVVETGGVYKSGKKKGLKRTRKEYQCAICKKSFPTRDVQVDHIIPCGSLNEYDDIVVFIKKLLCDVSNLQILCKPCHKKKTNEERKKK